MESKQEVKKRKTVGEFTGNTSIVCSSQAINTDQLIHFIVNEPKKEYTKIDVINIINKVIDLTSNNKNKKVNIEKEMTDYYSSYIS